MMNQVKVKERVMRWKDIIQNLLAGITSLKYKIGGVSDGYCMDLDKFSNSYVIRTIKGFFNEIERRR